MMTSLNGTIFRVTGHLCGEFTGHVVHYDVTVMVPTRTEIIKESPYKETILQKKNAVH